MRRVLIFIALALTGSALFFAGPASAQQGSPSGPCRPTSSTQNLGTFAVGQTVNAKLTPTCVWTAGQPATVTVNSTNIPGKRTAADGTIGIKVFIKSVTKSDVDDPVEVNTVCGNNTIVATAPSAVAATPVTHTANYTVTCVVAAGTSAPLVRTGSDTNRAVAVAIAFLVLGSVLAAMGRRTFVARW